LHAGSCTGKLSDVEVIDMVKGWNSFYHALDQDILTDSYMRGHVNGTTALITVIHNSRLYCSNAGKAGGPCRPVRPLCCRPLPGIPRFVINAG
jgi:hypothetical protein